MNLYFRLLFLYFRTRYGKKISIFDPFVTEHIVFPNDLDLLGHMNNGRYFTITDLARIEMLVRAGIWKEIRKRKLYPVMAGETVQFRKPLLPFQKYCIISKSIGWDEKFFYVEHRFISSTGLHALVMVKVMVIGDGKIRVSPAKVLGFVSSENIPAISITEPISTWRQSTESHWNEYKLQMGLGQL